MIPKWQPQQTMTWMSRVIVGLLVLAHAAGVSAQVRVIPRPNLVPPSGKPPARQGLFMPNRSLTQHMQACREMLAREDYVSGLRRLQQLIDTLDGKEDAFFNPDPALKSRFVSLKSAASELIAKLPRAGLDSYELQQGPMAQRMLDEALAANSLTQVETVARRYFHTRAGHRAVEELGNRALDRGDVLNAALQFQRLRREGRRAYQNEPVLSLKTAICLSRAGMQPQALQTLDELKAATPGGQLTLAGRRYTFFERSADAAEWLHRVLGDHAPLRPLLDENWTMFRGTPARSGVHSPASVGWDDRWSFDTIPMVVFAELDPSKARQMEALENRISALRSGPFENLLTLPACHPLVIDDLVVLRSLGSLKAVRPETGELVWEAVTPDRSLDKLLEEPGPNGTSSATRNPQHLDMFLAQRAWRDLTAGTLSSDGRHVFMVDDLGFQGAYTTSRGQRLPTAPKAYNTLKAFDLASGKFVWQIGGPREEPPSTFGGYFFLGPPLVLGNRLYCLAELNGEIRLLVLLQRQTSTAPVRWTVALDWSQSLVVPPVTIGSHPLRRMSGISPSYADGVLICPTTSGAVIGLDLGRRQLLWGYQYAAEVAQRMPNMRIPVMRAPTSRTTTTIVTEEDEGRWVDAIPTIADGRVVVTPRDSNELHCVDLKDGRLLWRQPRGQGVYVAAIHRGLAVVVGRSQVHARRLADGRTIWTASLGTDTPSGRGYQSAGHYYLPLKSGEIMGIQLENGRVLARSASRLGNIPGNLVASHGSLFSQDVERLVAYRPLAAVEQQIAQRLAQNPEAPQGLVDRGELRLQQGEEQAGLNDLRSAWKQLQAAYQAAEDDEKLSRAFQDSGQMQSLRRSRGLLASAWMGGLRTDFGGYVKYSKELETLLDDPADTFQFHRVMAAGLHTSGQFGPAFQHYLVLVASSTGDQQLIPFGAAQSVRVDRWVRPRVAQILNDAEPQLQLRIQRLLNDRLQEALESDGVESLELLAESFSDSPIAHRARNEIINRLDPTQDRTRVLFQLRRLAHSDLIDVAVAATVQMGELLLDGRSLVAIERVVSQLESRWDDVKFAGMTGREHAARMRADPKFQALLSTRATWPQSELNATAGAQGTSIRAEYPIQVQGPRGNLQDWTFRLSSSRQFMLAFDGDGRQQWQVPLSVGVSRFGIPGGGCVVHISDGLLVVNLSGHFVVMDTRTVNKTPRVLWKAGLYDGGGTERSRPMVRQMIVRGAGKMVFTDPRGRPLGQIGPVNDQFICYQSETKLYCVDSLTGRPLWTRAGIARGATLFGNDVSVGVIPPGSRFATLYRALDGELQGNVELPDNQVRVAFAGTQVLCWKAAATPQAQKAEARLINLADNAQVWTTDFKVGAKYQRLGHDELAVVEPQGQFHLLRIADGKTLFSAPIDPEPKMRGFAVRRMHDRYLLMINRPAENAAANMRIMSSISGGTNVNGPVYALDSQTGKRLWRQEISGQAVDLNQPHNLPILVFAIRKYQLFRPGQSGVQRRYAALILDTRNGKVLFKKDSPTAMSPYRISADVAKQEIDVAFYRETVEVRYTKPADDQAGAKPQSEEEKPAPDDTNKPPSPRPKS